MQKLELRIYKRDGFTLVELMISVGLFGVLSLFLSQLFSHNSLLAERAKNEAKMTEEIVEFTNAIEALLTNSTSFGPMSLLGPDGDGSWVEDSTKASDAAYFSSAAYFYFETEDAQDPAIQASASTTCALSGPQPRTATVGSALYVRGCKRALSISYTPPTQIATVGSTKRVGNPGTVIVYDNTQSGYPGPGTVLHKLSGVYYFRMGIPKNSSGYSARDKIKFEIRLKSRANPLNAVPNTDKLEGWYPIFTGSSGDEGFTEGTHRSIQLDVSMRNLNTRGVQFGKPYSIQRCVDDGAATSAAQYCCSGYVDAAGTTCVSMANCVKAGLVSPTDDVCCSHMRSDTGSVCL